MVQKIKIFILKFFSEWQKVRLRFKGVVMGKGCFINKSPRVQLTSGSRVILGENVTLTSNARHNPLLDHPVILRTLTSEAVIEMKNYSGMSGTRIVCANRVTIGEHTIIGANTLIYDSDGHSYTPERGWNTSRLQTGRPITIGDKCFIGVGCIILGGVTIGDRCLISAGTVITQDIPAGHKAFGNPAIITPLPKALGGSDEEVPSSHKSESVEASSIAVFLSKVQEVLELSSLPESDEEFRENAEWDSIQFLTLVSFLQDDFGIKLSSDTFNNLRTWQDIYNLTK